MTKDYRHYSNGTEQQPTAVAASSGHFLSVQQGSIPEVPYTRYRQDSVFLCFASTNTTASSSIVLADIPVQLQSVVLHYGLSLIHISEPARLGMISYAV